MSYQLLPNLIFFFCILGIIVLILRRLPEAQNLDTHELKKDAPEHKLRFKGIPTQSFSRLKAFFKFWLHKIWSSALEAKDLRPQQPSVYRIKKLFNFKIQSPKVSAEIVRPQAPADFDGSVKDEELELLDQIKLEPKNYQLYDDLGRMYIKKHQYQDAKDLYLYLVGHQAGNSHFHARLAGAAFHLKDYALSARHFERSLALDKMHPNRYYNLGLALECQEKWRAAAEAFKKAVQMDPENKKYSDALEKANRQI